MEAGCNIYINCDLIITISLIYPLSGYFQYYAVSGYDISIRY